jgi:hypothetical protein
MKETANGMVKPMSMALSKAAVEDQKTHLPKFKVMLNSTAKLNLLDNIKN